MQDFFPQIRAAEPPPPKSGYSAAASAGTGPRGSVPPDERFEDLVNRVAKRDDTAAPEPERPPLAEAETPPAEGARDGPEETGAALPGVVPETATPRSDDPAEPLFDPKELAEPPAAGAAQGVADAPPGDTVERRVPGPVLHGSDHHSTALSETGPETGPGTGTGADAAATGLSGPDRTGTAVSTGPAAVVVPPGAGPRAAEPVPPAAPVALAAGADPGGLRPSTNVQADFSERSGGAVQGAGGDSGPPAADRPIRARAETAPTPPTAAAAPLAARATGGVTDSAIARETAQLSGEAGERVLTGLTDPRSSTEPLRMGQAPVLTGQAAQAGDIGQQLVARLARAELDGLRVPGQVDLTLSPAELGRVRLSMAPGEAGLVVTILAERPETLELMRRHGEQLLQEFRQAGFERTELSFGGAGSGQAGDQSPESQEGPEPHLTEERGGATTEAAAQGLVLTEGLNLRL